MHLYMNTCKTKDKCIRNFLEILNSSLCNFSKNNCVIPTGSDQWILIEKVYGCLLNTQTEVVG